MVVVLNHDSSCAHIQASKHMKQPIITLHNNFDEWNYEIGGNDMIYLTKTTMMVTKLVILRHR